MKRRLQKVYWRIVLLTMLMAAAAIGVAAKLKIDDTRNNLTAMFQAAGRWTLDSNDDLQSLAESIAMAAPPIRVTFLMDSGLVLADSIREEPEVNHYKDPEIETARRGGTGKHLRMSAGNASFDLYMAQRIAPQLILRVSYPVLEIAKILIPYGSLLLALFLILYLMERTSIAKVVRDVEIQFEDVRRLLDGEIPEVEAVFPDYQPSLDAISYRIRRLKEDYREILQTAKLRSDFVANASHELRSPLTSVRGFAEMLEEGLAETPEEEALCLATIRSECDRMLDVIEDILRIQKAERAPEKPEGTVNVAQIAAEVERSLGPQAEKKRIRLLAEGDLTLQAAEKDIWEILYNMLDNAIRYGRDGGTASVKLSDDKILIEDDGIGIAPEHLGHIFEQFYRVDEERNPEIRGTGLGLSIVRAIVRRYGWEIHAESCPGKGSRFIILLNQ